MLPLTDICEEEEEEEDDDNDDDDNDIHGRDRKERNRILRYGYSPDSNRSGGCNEITCLLIGDGNTSLYPGDICDADIDTVTCHKGCSGSVDLDCRSCVNSNGNSRVISRANGCVNRNDNSRVISRANDCVNSNGYSGDGLSHRSVLGQLHANGKGSPMTGKIERNNTITTTNNNHKLDGYTLTSHREFPNTGVHSGSKQDPRDTVSTSNQNRSSPTPPPHSSSSSTSVSQNHTQQFLYKTEMDHLPLSSCYSSSSSSPSSPPGQSQSPNVNTGLGQDCCIHTRLGDGEDFGNSKEEIQANSNSPGGHCVQTWSPREQTRCHQYRHDCKVDMEKVKATSLTRDMTDGTTCCKDVGLSRPDVWPKSKTMSITTTTTIAAITTPSDNSSHSSSSYLSANQNDKLDDVTLPNSAHPKGHQTMIPIHEVKRGLTRKQILQLSAMSGIGFVLVAFIVLWIMSPVWF